MIQIKDVVKSYKHVQLVYPQITIDKRITLLVGANGSGKSTLFKALLGLVEYHGTITTNETFSYAPEHPQFPKDCTVEVFLDAICDSPYNELLHDFGLDHKRHAIISQLSKGMQGKLNIIQAYCHNKTTMLLDEPTEGLDIQGLQQLKTILKETTKNVIISTHNSDYFMDIAMGVIRLD
ncbi:ATP-binding cassette domain-containing protein [Candidatus Xianfuyuplasma coldseepsis]|uniref:ATP-binding cassette domain-containing protein n=1 Tax=Candidatus Xianfuyuplasma coldseepsis TaxID=2782163 RepID=A0A7L7KTS6_9MOLU|nr:ATP-binding cassette domain-containing protein [Xianfuyuplasma coldseepsis]QMS85712.1 ATP-binding cassette domain-containing protein [Xianfuyuplasma coldseepsis]